MQYYFAPMEGFTDAVYRRTHRRWYPGIAKYYTPFITPTQNRVLTRRQLRELSPENNADVPLVPQLLGKNAQDFLWMVYQLADIGYTEVNLNLGCPSNTVCAKGKGAGFLAYPSDLDDFLQEIFACSPIPISIKTRIGITSPEEFGVLLRIFNQYPVKELIIHPRTKAEMYLGSVHINTFAFALKNTQIPICYNGNLFRPEDINSFAGNFPEVNTVMMGRGLLSNPALHLCCQSNQQPDKMTLYHFHADLCVIYPAVFESYGNAARRMKGLWHYMLDNFQDGESYRRKIIKAKTWVDLMDVTEEIFSTLELKQNRNLSCETTELT